jgi:hypothetical protein
MEISTDDTIFEMADITAVCAARNPEWEALHSYFNHLAQSLESNGWKKRNGMTQHDKIMRHLKKAGSITVREAIVEYSIQSLTKVISVLRTKGNKINSNVKYHPVTGQKYVRYTLAS